LIFISSSFKILSTYATNVAYQNILLIFEGSFVWI
jgi:hypothetical protein